MTIELEIIYNKIENLLISKKFYSVMNFQLQ